MSIFDDIAKGIRDGIKKGIFKGVNSDRKKSKPKQRHEVILLK